MKRTLRWFGGGLAALALGRFSPAAEIETGTWVTGRDGRPELDVDITEVVDGTLVGKVKWEIVEVAQRVHG